MAVKISGEYTGKLNTKITHGPSGTTLTTAAPVDNHGDGSSFSPTDLAAAALGACMLTIMGIVADRRGIDLTGCRFELEKHMSNDPRRIGELPLIFHMPAGLGEADRTRLERGALTCPVHRSLHPEVDIPVRFLYAGE